MDLKKIADFFAVNFEYFFKMQIPSKAEALKHPIAAKPLEASGEAASMYMWAYRFHLRNEYHIVIYQLIKGTMNVYGRTQLSATDKTDSIMDCK